MFIDHAVSAADHFGLGGDEVTEAIGRVIAAEAVFVGVDFEHVFGPVGVVLHRRQGFQEESAALVDEEFRGQAAGGVAEPLEDLRSAARETEKERVERKDWALGVGRVSRACGRAGHNGAVAPRAQSGGVYRRCVTFCQIYAAQSRTDNNY
jgi:hypothetical protein